jgi:nucleoside-diphosphate-sugar epimerase
MSRVVIAGGSGYLGRALAARLAREGHDVVVLTRASSKDEVRKFEGRFGCRTAVAHPVRGLDAERHDRCVV